MATPPDFSVGQVLTAAQMNAVGLWLVTSGTLSSTTTSFQNCFTDDFTNYLIVVDRMTMSNSNSLFYRYLNNATDRDTGYAWAFTGLTSANVAANSTASGEVRGFVGYAMSGPNNQVAGGFTMTIYAPKFAERTFAYTQSTSIESSTFVGRQGTTVHDSGVANNGIRFHTNSAVTMTGNVKIYGYNQ